MDESSFQLQADWEKWETSTSKSSLVTIGTHRLFLSVSGPPRTAGEPIVIIIPGAGDSTASYPVVERLVSKFARILLYDRSGLGRSENGPDRSIATVAAGELHMLLTATRIAPPYILVAHSYGGIIAREYLHLYADEISGMVLADSSTERHSQYFRIPDPNIMAVMGDLKVAKVTGLRAASKLSPEEWKARAIEFARGANASNAEGAALVEVCETLAKKDQFKRGAMGGKPLSVIRCEASREFERIYEKGVEAGNGTDEERRAFREFLDRMPEFDKELKEEQLQLSSNSRYLYLPDCGHNVHLIRPDVIAEEICWVIQNSSTRIHKPAVL